MTERIKKILSQVRQYLGEISTDNLKDKQIYSKANLIQDEILEETKCNQISFEIYTKANEESYDISLENADFIKGISTSWDGELKYIQPNRWDEYSTTGSSYPCYYTIFENQIKFRPNPLHDDDTIIIWAYQESTINKIDADIDPEVPKSADRCLIFGICAEYQPEKYFARYLNAREGVAIRAHSQVGVVKEGSINW